MARKVVAIENITVDGIVDSGEGLGFEWTHRGYSDEVAAFGDERIRADVDTAVYGRRTYEGMYGYWSQQPNAQSGEHERRHGEWINALDKIVCSTTLARADWHNTRLISENAADEIRAAKARPGGSMAIYASPKLVHSFLDAGLIDEFRLILHPLALGTGTPLFHDEAKVDLDLLESHTFGSGAVYLRYQVR